MDAVQRIFQYHYQAPLFTEKGAKLKRRKNKVSCRSGKDAKQNSTSEKPLRRYSKSRSKRWQQALLRKMEGYGKSIDLTEKGDCNN